MLGTETFPGGGEADAVREPVWTANWNRKAQTECLKTRESVWRLGVRGSELEASRGNFNLLHSLLN